MAEANSGSKEVQPTHRGTAFADMNQGEKLVWVCKLAVCVMTFGFAFPAVMED